MDFWGSASGMMVVEFVSADPVAALAAIQNAGIPILELEKKTELCYRFHLSRQYIPKLRAVLEKRGEALKILRRLGLFWTIMNLWKRPVLVVGMLALLVFSVWVPGRVFFVRVEGNLTVPTNKILEQAQQCGIGFGASRRAVRSEKMKNALLSISPELQWAGVNTYGCVAVITVRERNDMPREETVKGVSSIVASRDGIIRELTVLKGSAACKPGDAVKAGQVLVSGYTDCGLYIQATQAEGEVFAQTQRNISVIYPVSYGFRQEKTAVYKKYSLIIGKKRINFSKDSGISGATCAKIERDYILTLPGGFSLPVRLVEEQITVYRDESTCVENARQILSSFAVDYLSRQMVAGKLESAGEVFTMQEDACRLDGIYGCYEMIGISRREESLHEDH